MKFRVSPDDKRVLPEPVPIGDGTDLAPNNPVNSETAVVTTVYRVGGRKAESVSPKKPVNSTGERKHSDDLAPSKAVSSETAAVTMVNSTRAAIGYRVGGRKVKSVIPKKRKLVKTMMFHCIKDFLKSLFRPSPETDNRPKPITHD